MVFAELACREPDVLVLVRGGPQKGLWGGLGVPGGVMGSLKGSSWGYGNPKWDYGVLSGVLGSLKGSSWRYGDPKWGSVGFWGSPVGLWGP